LRVIKQEALHIVRVETLNTTRESGTKAVYSQIYLRGKEGRSCSNLLIKIKLGKYITLIDVEVIVLRKVLKLDPCTVRQRST
jgi:hypothetical protein